MSLKRYIEGKGWVSIAGPSTSNNSKAINVSVSDTSNLFDTDNVDLPSFPVSTALCSN